MKVLFSQTPFPPDTFAQHSIFLAGPTPRDASVDSWRPEAITLLAGLDYPGTVLVPESAGLCKPSDFLAQVTWERAGLERAARIVFWVPRHVDRMPAFTTNIEFGYWLARTPDRVLYGRPGWAHKCDDLDWLYEHETKRKPHDALDPLLRAAID